MLASLGASLGPILDDIYYQAMQNPRLGGREEQKEANNNYTKECSKRFGLVLACMSAPLSGVRDGTGGT